MLKPSRGSSLPLRVLLPILGALLFAVGPARTEEVEFAVENKILVGEQARVVGRSVTVFSGSRVYDFALPPSRPRTAIFDIEGQRILDVDPSQELTIEIPLDAVENLTRKLQTLRPPRRDPLIEFLLAPRFQPPRLTDESIELDSRWLRYAARTITPPESHRGAVVAYLRFSDLAAKLAPALDANAPPPFARLELNRTLEARGRLPVEVRLTRHYGPSNRGENQLRAEHRYRWTLSSEDLERIEQAERDRLRYPTIAFAEYRSRLTKSNSRVR